MVPLFSPAFYRGVFSLCLSPSSRFLFALIFNPGWYSLDSRLFALCTCLQYTHMWLVKQPLLKAGAVFTGLFHSLVAPVILASKFYFNVVLLSLFSPLLIFPSLDYRMTVWLWVCRSMLMTGCLLPFSWSPNPQSHSCVNKALLWFHCK